MNIYEYTQMIFNNFFLHILTFTFTFTSYLNLNINKLEVTFFDSAEHISETKHQT